MKKFGASVCNLKIKKITHTGNKINLKFQLDKDKKKKEKSIVVDVEDNSLQLFLANTMLKKQ
jgi:hypothetical protein